MLRHRPSLIPPSFGHPCRFLHSTRRAHAAVGGEASGSIENEDMPSGPKKKVPQGRSRADMRDNSHNSYMRWLKTEGAKYRRPTLGPNWLTRPDDEKRNSSSGPAGPFPLNTSFRPAIPLPHIKREEIYQRHMADPEGNTVRKLSAMYGISLSRVEAILRLQDLEQQWKKRSKHLQTGFQAHMELYLGSSGLDSLSPSIYRAAREAATDAGLEEEVEPANEELVRMADEQVELDTPEDADARHRYQRMFWEDSKEIKNPTMPDVLEGVRKHAKAVADSKERRTASHTHADITIEGNKKGRRAPIRFVDVGSKFVDPKRHGERR